MTERTRKFLASYLHDGAWWVVEFYATDLNDAATICRAHSLRLDGEHVITIPAVGKSTWLPNLIIRLRNVLRGMDADT